MEKLILKSLYKDLKNYKLNRFFLCIIRFNYYLVINIWLFVYKYFALYINSDF